MAKERHPADDVLRVGEIEVRPGEGLASVAGRTLTLSVREFGLLVALCSKPGRVVSRDELFARVWGGELRRGDRSVDVYVHKLRVKLDAALPQARTIHTHVGFGYRLEIERFVRNDTIPAPSHPFHIDGTRR